MEKDEIRKETIWQHRVMIALFQFVRGWPDWILYRIFAPLLALMTFVFFHSLRNAAMKNMRQVTRAQRRKSKLLVWGRAYLVLLHNAYNWADLIRTSRMTTEEIRSEVEIIGLEHVKQIADRGLLISAHNSGYFPASVSLAAEDIHLFTPVEVLANATLNELVQKLRAGKGLMVEPLGLSAIREASRRLHRGGMVGLLVDRNIQGPSFAILFFGRLAEIPIGPAKMAIKANCPIVFSTCERIGWGKFRVVFYPPIEPGDYSDEVALTEVFVSLVERHVENNPSQWLPLEPIWEEEES